MKLNPTKLISTTVHKIAKKSSSTVCDWRVFQPKVPKQLRSK